MLCSILIYFCIVKKEKKRWFWATFAHFRAHNIWQKIADKHRLQKIIPDTYALALYCKAYFNHVFLLQPVSDFADMVSICLDMFWYALAHVSIDEASQREELHFLPSWQLFQPRVRKIFQHFPATLNQTDLHPWTGYNDLGGDCLVMSWQFLRVWS